MGIMAEISKPCFALSDQFRYDDRRRNVSKDKLLSLAISLDSSGRVERGNRNLSSQGTRAAVLARTLCFTHYLPCSDSNSALQSDINCTKAKAAARLPLASVVLRNDALAGMPFPFRPIQMSFLPASPPLSLNACHR
jgi:hypothetical protein